MIAIIQNSAGKVQTENPIQGLTIKSDYKTIA
jgi:hypothetical protein